MFGHYHKKTATCEKCGEEKKKLSHKVGFWLCKECEKEELAGRTK